MKTPGIIRLAVSVSIFAVFFSFSLPSLSTDQNGTPEDFVKDALGKNLPPYRIFEELVDRNASREFIRDVVNGLPKSTADAVREQFNGYGDIDYTKITTKRIVIDAFSDLPESEKTSPIIKTIPDEIPLWSTVFRPAIPDITKVDPERVEGIDLGTGQRILVFPIDQDLLKEINTSYPPTGGETPAFLKALAKGIEYTIFGAGAVIVGCIAWEFAALGGIYATVTGTSLKLAPVIVGAAGFFAVNTDKKVYESTNYTCKLVEDGAIVCDKK
jgi:hypothetical protein